MLYDKTLPKLLLENYTKWGDRKVALKEKKYGIWHTYTWDNYYTRVKYFSLGMVSLGLNREDKVCIIGDNAPEWVIAELAVQARGGIPAGVFTDSRPAELKYAIISSDASFLVVRDQEQVDKALEIKSECPQVKKVIYWDSKGMRGYDKDFVMSYEEVYDLGKDYSDSHPGAFESDIEQGNSDDVACFLFTSGTGGKPKTVMHSYRSLLCQATYWLAFYEMLVKDSYVSYAPLAWIPEQTCGLILPLSVGYVVNYPEKSDTVQQDIREISPSIMAMSPAMWESRCSTVLSRMATANFLQKLVYNMFLKVGYRIADYRFAGKKIDLFWNFLAKIGEQLLYKPLRDNLGLRHIRHAYSGGATMGPDTFRFFRAMGVGIKQIYGMTESGGVNAGHRENDVKHESVGTPLLGNEIRISEHGEIYFRSGSIFLGYYKNPDATNEVLVDGWLHSGDAGFIDDDGHIICIGRLTDLMVLKSGSKFSPIFIETKLKFSPYIKDSVAIGGKDRPYVSALISIDFETVARWAEDQGITFTTYSDLSQNPNVYKLINDNIQQMNKILPEEARIRKFGNLYKELDADESELTRTRKLRRGFFEERYPELIDLLYEEDGEISVESEITYRDGRVGKVKASFRIKSVEGGD